MFCTNCGKAIEPGTKFCPHCGALQTAESAPAAPVPPMTVAPPRIEPGFGAAPAMAFPTVGLPNTPAPANKSAIWAGVGALVVALVGGVGYWGWSNKVAGDEAVRKLATDQEARQAGSDEAGRKLADEEQRRIAAEKVADAAEIAAAQAMLDKRITAEEAQAQSQAGQPKR